MTKYLIMDSSAHQPSSRKWKHPRRRIAVVEVEPGAIPKMISTRARGLVRIVQTWEDLYVGKTQACQYRQALLEAKALIDKLKGE